jgi:hypothetical protein
VIEKRGEQYLELERRLEWDAEGTVNPRSFLRALRVRGPRESRRRPTPPKLAQSAYLSALDVEGAVGTVSAGA